MYGNWNRTYEPMNYFPVYGQSPYWQYPPAAPYWEGPWAGGRFYDYDLDYILEDDEIHDLVRDNIDLDPYIPRSDRNNIKVEVKDAVVTLTGEVRNKRSKYLSYTDAFLCDGVIDVKTEVTIKERKKSKNGE